MSDCAIISPATPITLEVFAVAVREIGVSVIIPGIWLVVWVAISLVVIIIVRRIIVSMIVGVFVASGDRKTFDIPICGCRYCRCCPNGSQHRYEVFSSWTNLLSLSAASVLQDIGSRESGFNMLIK